MMFLRHKPSKLRGLDASPLRTAATLAVPLTATAAAITAAFLAGGCGSGNGTAPANLFASATATPVPTGFPTALPTATPTPFPSGNLTPPYLGKVAFISRRGSTERGQIYVMNPDGSQVTQLKPLTTYGDSTELQYPGNHFMSADGSKFLLTYDFGTGSGGVNFLVNADGTNQRNISALLDPTADTTGSLAFGHVSDIGMNTNGSALVFVYTDFSFSGSTNTSTTNLVTMNADGSARTTRYSIPGSGFDQTLDSPIFAPDGQTIYFIQGATQYANAGGLSGFVGAVYRLGPGETTPTQIAPVTTVSGEGSALVFPALTINGAGTKLAFVSSAGGSSEIFAVNTDGTGLTQLTNNTAVDKSPAFTTDGTKIIFASNRDGNSELYSMNPNGSGQTRLTYNIELDEEPTTRASKTRSASTKKAAR